MRSVDRVGLRCDELEWQAGEAGKTAVEGGETSWDRALERGGGEVELCCDR